MAESAGIVAMGITHHAILDWLVLNPEKSRRECAAHFRITQAWLSCVVNSGCFQAELAQRRMEISSTVAQDLPARMQTVGHMALDNITRHLETSTDPEFALKALDSAMKGLGAGKASVVINANQQNNVQQLFATPEDLAKARAMMGQAALGGGSPLPTPAISPPPSAPEPQRNDFFEGGSICEAIAVEVVADGQHPNR